MNFVDSNSVTILCHDSCSEMVIATGGRGVDVCGVLELDGLTVLAGWATPVFGGVDSASVTRVRSMIPPGLTSRTCEACSGGTGLGSTKVTSVP